MSPPLTGIVLAGGQSRRLGRDKAALEFDARPLLHLVVERVTAVCAELIVALPTAGGVALPPGAGRCVRDAAEGLGPLGGIQAGMRAASNEFALVVACDMPFLNARLLRHMAAVPRRYQALVLECGGRRHPLHAIYSRACLPVIDSLLEQGVRSVEELLARVDVHVMSEPEVTRFDPDGMSVFNLNDAGDLEAARQYWAQRWRPAPRRT